MSATAKPRPRGLRGHPVLAHELRRVLRLTTRLGHTTAGRRAVGIALVAAYLGALAMAATSLLSSHAGGWGTGEAEVVLCLGTLLLVLLAPGLTSGVIAGERQRGTWEMLLVTPLRPLEILLGKLGGRLAGVGLLLLAGLPFVALAIGTDRVALPWLLATALIAPAALLGLSVVGLVCSARCRDVATATATAYGITGVLCLLIPLGEALFSVTAGSGGEPWLCVITCPFIAVVVLGEHLSGARYAPSQGELGLVCVLFYLLLAAGGLRLLAGSGAHWLHAHGERPTARKKRGGDA